MNSHPSRLPTLAGFAALLFWGASTAIARSLIEKLGGLASAAGVELISGFCGCLFLLISGRMGAVFRSLPRRYFLVCGACFLAYMFFFYTAFELAETRAQSLAVGLANYLWPILTLLLSIPILGRRASFLIVPGVLLALVGVTLAGSHGELSAAALGKGILENPLPFILASAGALVWALYSNLSRKWAEGADSGPVFLFMLAAGLALLPLSFVAPTVPRWSAAAVGELLAITAVATAGYFLWDVAMKKGDHTLVVAASYLSPLIYVFLGAFYLGIAPGLEVWIACGLIIGGAIISKIAVRETAAH